MSIAVAPVRERGLKYPAPQCLRRGWYGRSREGAWIEIRIHQPEALEVLVAPVRERGLK